MSLMGTAFVVSMETQTIVWKTIGQTNLYKIASAITSWDHGVRLNSWWK